MFSAKMIMILIFCLCELLAAIGFPRESPVNLTALGLFFFAVSLMIGG